MDRWNTAMTHVASRTREITVLARRFLLVFALMFWQGGFLFYTGIVVPIGGAVLGSHTQQGFVTQAVTHRLNLAGGVALGLWACDILFSGRAMPRTRWLAWLLWLLLAGLLVCLVSLHVRLDAMLDIAAQEVRDPTRYRPWHRIYLWLSTVQWGLALTLLLWTLHAWRADKPERQRK